MSDTKVYQFGETGNSSLNALLPFLQQRGIDPAYFAGMMGGGNGFGNFGINEIIALVVIAALFGNNNGGGLFGGGGNQQSAVTDLLSNEIQRNGVAISQLASSLNCSVGDIQNAINNVATQICNLSAQNGQSALQIINSVQAGNASLATQIAECCCKTTQAITAQAYENQLATCQQTNTLVNTANANTLSLRDAATANTNAILGRLDAMEKATLYDKIDALREKNGTLTTQINLERQNQYTAGVVAQSVAPINAALSDLSKRLADIECNQPEVAKIPYIPAAGNYIPVNYSVPMHFGVSNYGGCGYNYGC